MKELEVVKENLSVAEVKKQVNLIQQVMRDVMRDGEHYGTIPGCGDKKALLKPGAEKLSMVFRLRPIINPASDVVIEDLGDGHKNIIVYTHITSLDGIELATGIGSCSTKETKYRYRGGSKISTGLPIPSQYWNLKKEGKLAEAQALIGGEGFSHGKVNGAWEICEIGEKVENPDIADTYNTVLKMAKKRSHIDGIISATAASDIFTQDIDEDLEDKEAQKPAVTPEKEARPEEKKQASSAPSKATAAQVNAIKKIASRENIDDAIDMLLFEKYGVDKIEGLTMKQASEIIASNGACLK